MIYLKIEETYINLMMNGIFAFAMNKVISRNVPDDGLFQYDVALVQQLPFDHVKFKTIRTIMSFRKGTKYVAFRMAYHSDCLNEIYLKKNIKRLMVHV